MQNSVPPPGHRRGHVLRRVLRQVGGTLGTAVFLSIFLDGPNKISSAYDSAAQTPSYQAAAAAHPDQVTGCGTTSAVV